jgi:hypothetical protein
MSNRKLSRLSSAVACAFALLSASCSPGKAQAPYTNFCAKKTFHEKDGRYYGGWSSSFAGACIDGVPGSIDKGAVIEKSEVGNCSGSGETVIKVVHN